MNRGGLYEVTGARAYRGHRPGTTFEAVLNAAAEHRAINRGDIRLVERIRPSLRPGSYTFPPGWLTNNGEEGPQDG